jgi:hypothetical protein
MADLSGTCNVFCAGSLGTVDPRDVGKVVFDGGVARLSGGVVAPGGVVRPAEVEAHAVPGAHVAEQVSATIRYPVRDTFNQVGLGLWVIIMRWRDGHGGRVVANLMEMSVPQPSPAPDQHAADSRPLLTFDTAGSGTDGLGPIYGPPEPFFRTHLSVGLEEADPLYRYEPDVGSNIYFFEVTLTGPWNSPTPAAIAAIGISGRPGGV